jgi:hypothetical protein
MSKDIKRSIEELAKLRMQKEELGDKMRLWSIQMINQAKDDGLSPAMAIFNFSVTCAIVAKVSGFPLRDLVSTFVSVAEDVYSDDNIKSPSLQ